MPLFANGEQVSPSRQTPFSYGDTRAGNDLAERLAQAKERSHVSATPQKHEGDAGVDAPAFGLATLPAVSGDEDAREPGIDTTDANAAPEAGVDLDSTVEVAVVVQAPVDVPVLQPEWTDLDEETWQALKLRLFDPGCTEVSILPNPPEAQTPYTVAVNQDTRNCRDDAIVVPDEDSLVRIVKERILRYTNADVPVDSALPPIAVGTFTYTDVDEDGVSETVRARVQILSPPAMSRVGVVFCKLPRSELNLTDMVNNGTLSEDMAHFLNGAVQAGASVVFSGAPGAGKTCLLNACTRQISTYSKVAVLQDVDELPLEHVKVQQKLFTHRAVARAAGSIHDGSMSSLIEVVKLSRPDILITGECRDGAMLDHLEAASIFSRGALTTLHAKSAKQALDNVAYFAGKHPDAPKDEKRLWRFITENLDLIVQLGVVGEKRRVTEIVAVGDTVVEGYGKPPLTPLWTFVPASDTEDEGWRREMGPVPEPLQARFEKANVRNTHLYPVRG